MDVLENGVVAVYGDFSTDKAPAVVRSTSLRAELTRKPEIVAVYHQALPVCTCRQKAADIVLVYNRWKPVIVLIRFIQRDDNESVKGGVIIPTSIEAETLDVIPNTDVFELDAA
jgi:hypothetical protein